MSSGSGSVAAMELNTGTMLRRRRHGLHINDRKASTQHHELADMGKPAKLPA